MACTRSSATVARYASCNMADVAISRKEPLAHFGFPVTPFPFIRPVFSGTALLFQVTIPTNLINRDTPSHLVCVHVTSAPLFGLFFI